GAIMEHPRWKSGNITTGFIAEEFPDGFHGVELGDTRQVKLAAVAVYMNKIHADRAVLITGQLSGRPRKLPSDLVVQIGGWSQPVSARMIDAGLEVTFKDESGKKVGEHLVSSDWVPGQSVFVGKVDGQAIVVQLDRAKQGYNLSYRGSNVCVVVRTAAGHRLAALMPEKIAADTSKFLLCPMPGLVKSIAVEEGQDVKVGDTLAVVEAMKMENILRAEKDCKVTKISAKAGDSLAVDAVIMEFGS
ncbi:MAG: biotin/lipoyl-containing protein, partial [Parvibaculum sp.]|nr:biotin/lipoyl-containing protein [Parvibaculum sp.]